MRAAQTSPSGAAPTVAPCTLIPPFQYAGGNLGLTDTSDPWIYFYDSTGTRFLIHSVEWLLKNIDSFKEGRDRDQPLACAAVHYGLDVYALIDGRDHHARGAK